MTEPTDLRESLNAIAAEVRGWRTEAARLRTIAAETDSGVVDEALLVSVEQTSGDIYRGIARFDALFAEIDRTSHSAADQIAEVGDALRLVLMEITELGTRLYSRHSGLDSLQSTQHG